MAEWVILVPIVARVGNFANFAPFLFGFLGGWSCRGCYPWLVLSFLWLVCLSLAGTVLLVRLQKGEAVASLNAESAGVHTAVPVLL